MTSSHQHGNHRHGHRSGSFSPTYNSWRGMMERCHYAKHPKFGDYGGRGIEVDPRWHSFENFLSDMGEKPDEHSIERLDSNRNYWLGNCIWLPQKLQQTNRRDTRLVTWRLRTMCIRDWEKELGWGYNTLRRRLNQGWSVERAFTQPLRT